jgi:hypothetical protein
MEVLRLRVEPTPNPNAMKFTLNRMLAPAGQGRTYSDPAHAALSPLAQRVLDVPGVASVFVLRDFVTVTRQPQAGWDAIVPAVEQILRDLFAADAPGSA